MMEEIFAKVLPADMPSYEYDEYKMKADRRNKELVESAKDFVLPNQQIRHCCTGIEGLIPQQCYRDVPFRMEEYGDNRSTVASSGCGILVAKFLERIFNNELNISVEELAKLAVEKGYRGYRKEKEGSYTPMGMKHVFFERFIPSLYGYSVRRAKSVEELLAALWDYEFPVLLLTNKIYKGEENSKDSHFVVMVGYNHKEVFVYDPEHKGILYVQSYKVFPGLRAAWIVSDKW